MQGQESSSVKQFLGRFILIFQNKGKDRRSFSQESAPGAHRSTGAEARDATFKWEGWTKRRFWASVSTRSIRISYVLLMWKAICDMMGISCWRNPAPVFLGWRWWWHLVYMRLWPGSLHGHSLMLILVWKCLHERIPRWASQASARCPIPNIRT